ncbi:MAG: hypothetical protein QF879_02265 [Candidatus Latescibacteria bacterium]|nr:hypothetical protein [Candidatus Latescibacterota bacterium]MDP7237516.1 hypothetical protein [Candidatus Latescibacterota bacterium]
MTNETDERVLPVAIKRTGTLGFLRWASRSLGVPVWAAWRPRVSKTTRSTLCFRNVISDAVSAWV